METIKKYQGFIAIGLAAVGLVALVVLSSNNKSDDTKTAEAVDAKTTQTEEKAAEKAKADAKVEGAYSYTAQAGDSYTVLARKAIQTFGINEKVSLSLAEIVAAETQLTVGAGSVELNEGQAVAIDKTAVKAAVDAVQKLGADVLGAWQVYVADVDFNTNAAGQAKK